MISIPVLTAIVVLAAVGAVFSVILTVRFLPVINFKKTQNILNEVTQSLSSLPPSNMDNLIAVNKIATEELNSVSGLTLMNSWKRFYNVAVMVYQRLAAPPAGKFFSFDAFIAEFNIKNSFFQVSLLISLFSVFSFASPAAVSLFAQNGEFSGFGIAAGLVSVFICLCALSYVCLTYRARVERMRAVFYLFVNSLDSCFLPSDSPNNTALILRSNKEASESYNNAINILTQKIDSFLLDKIAPGITDIFSQSVKQYIGPAISELNREVSANLEKIIENYGETLNEMPKAFFEKLSAETGNSLEKLSKRIERVAEQMSGAGESYSGMINNANDVMRQNLEACEQAYQAVFKVSDLNNEVLSFLKESSASAEKMSVSVSSFIEAAQQNTQVVSEIGSRSEKLSAEVGVKLEGFSKNMAEFTESLNEDISQTRNLSENTAKSLEAFYNKYITGMKNNMDIIIQSNMDMADMLSQSVLKLNNIGDEQIQESARRASEIIGGVSAEVSKLTEKMAQNVEDVWAKYTLQISKDVQLVMENNSQTAEALAKSVIKIDEAGSEQFEKASKVAAEMINGISFEMREAMQGIGTDVATSIQSAYKENEAYIQSLTERTERLVKEYDAYFAGINENTNHIMTDMDFTVTNALNRLSEDITAIIERFNTSISESADRYETNSKDLVHSFVEQTRDMGLYAHEINIDISKLSESLKDSVSIFNDKMKEGIFVTFEEFDKGVAEFTNRMTSTIEAIREAVDALPQALSAQQRS
ncbi:MAG: hypothetical protein LBS21_14750 [Clostridiales bacterium]|nr:hypothetical protein [Clostridiales bacterium]